MWVKTTVRAMFLIFVCIGAETAYAQDEEYPAHVQTSAPATARFEIVQSHLAARWTFLLDKYNGLVYQLVVTKDDELTWEKMPIDGLPKSSGPPKVRYQLFSSGKAARHTFLLNIEDSGTWVLVSAKDKNGDEFHKWQPFIDN